MRHALLLAGGQGRRFWPRSRKARPKQFMTFAGNRSLLQATSARLLKVVPAERQWVVTNAEYVALVRADLPAIPPEQVIGEPVGRNTAPAVGFAAALLGERDPDAVMLVQAADHWIRDEARFRRLVAAAFRHVAASRDALLIGFRPSRAATGFGYIETGRRLPAPEGVKLSEVAAYKEKPRLATARRYVASGRHLWNGCMFFWHARTILDGIARHLPVLAREIERFVRRVRAGDPVATALAPSYRRLEPVSIEHGVVERLDRKVVLEGDCGWEDVGTWLSLASLLPADPDGNVTDGRHLALDTRRSLVLSDRGLVVTLGVSDLIVVRDGDVVLILPRAREGEMREVVDRVEAEPGLGRYL